MCQLQVEDGRSHTICGFVKIIYATITVLITHERLLHDFSSAGIYSYADVGMQIYQWQSTNKTYTVSFIIHGTGYF